MPDKTFQLPLGPVATATLAALSEAVDILAAEIEPVPSSKPQNPYQPAPDFTPSLRLRKAAARGVAIVTNGQNAELSGATADAVAERLVKLGVPARVAASVAGKLAGRRALAVTPLNLQQRHGAIEALLLGRRLTDETI